MKIFLNGATGKMGKAVCEIVKILDKVVVAKGHLSLDDTERKKLTEVQVGIDFSTPNGTEEALEVAEHYRFPLVIGTTGLGEIQRQKITQASQKIKIIYANNFSIGVNVLYLLTQLSARLLSSSFQVEIVEKHHKHKKDSPSGTAKELIGIVKNEREIAKIHHGRCGYLGERLDEEIGVHSLRCGEIFGEHQVIFSGDREEIALEHRAFSREIFAKGALFAARWLINLPEKNGLFTMKDALGIVLPENLRQR